MNLQEAFSRQVEVTEWIDKHFSVPVPGDRRSMIAHTCFDLAIEHHSSICILFDQRRFGSMYALLRSVFESFVRGMFIRHSATEIEIDLFEKDKLNIEFKEFIARIETSIESPNSPLSKLKNSSWKIFNSFTHSGYQHLVRRNANGLVGPVNYHDEELTQSLMVAGSLALLAATEIASLADDKTLVDAAFDKMNAYSSS